MKNDPSSLTVVIDLPLSHETGGLRRYYDFASRYIDPRHVDVWCPPGYSEEGAARYPVIYMHDGQNLFDPASSGYGVDWGVDEAVTGLIQTHKIQGAIVVGVWNTASRYREYMPQKPLAAAQAQSLLAQFIQEKGGDPFSDAYLRVLVEELKPFIDANYRTLPDQPHTFVMGSSMGGLISLAAVEEYPDVFGGAGCLSNHWPIGQDVVVEYLGNGLPPAGVHKLYFDHGTEGLDAGYEPYQQRMDAFLQAAGYTSHKDWITLKFDGADHNEIAWRARVHIPLLFLLRE